MLNFELYNNLVFGKGQIEKLGVLSQSLKYYWHTVVEVSLKTEFTSK
jgi:hypothetical protein